MSHVCTTERLRTRRSPFAVQKAVESCLETLENRRLLSGYAVTDLGLQWGAFAASVGQTDTGYVAGYGYQEDWSLRGALYKDGASVTFGGIDGGLDSVPTAVNDNGQMTGSASDANYNSRAVIFNTDGSLIDLGTLDADDEWGYSNGYDINNSGVVVGESTGTLETEFGPIYGTYGFIYRDGQMTLLSLGGYSSATHINDAGYVLGSSGTLDGRFLAFLYDGTTIEPITLGGSTSIAADMNSSGVVVGGAATDADIAWYAFIHADGQTISIHPSVGQSSEARGINDAGQVIGNTFDHNTFDFPLSTAFIYENGAATLIEPLSGGLDSRAQFITESGLVVANSTEFVFAGGAVAGEIRSIFTWDDGVTTRVTPEGVHSTAWDVNASGHIVGSMEVNGETHGFVWNGQELLDLNTLLPADSGWIITEGVSINAGGEIVAHAMSVDGTNTTVFLLTPQSTPTEPEPETPTISDVRNHLASMLSQGQIDRLRGLLLQVELQTADWLLQNGQERLAIVSLGVARVTVELYHRQNRISTENYTILAADLDALIADLIASL